MCKNLHKSFSILAVLFVLTAFSASKAHAGLALNSLKKTIDKVIDIVSNPDNKGDSNMKKRRDLVRAILDESFDYKEMGKRSLGRTWKKLKPEGRKEFLDVFTMLLKTSYVKKIEGYKEEKIDYVSEELDGEYAVCKTIIHTDTVDIPVDYKMMFKNGRWSAYDVVIEGIGLVSNYRRQFKKLIRRKGYKKMIENMRSKAEDIIAEEKHL